MKAIIWTRWRDNEETCFFYEDVKTAQHYYAETLAAGSSQIMEQSLLVQVEGEKYLAAQTWVRDSELLPYKGYEIKRKDSPEFIVYQDGEALTNHASIPDAIIWIDSYERAGR